MSHPVPGERFSNPEKNADDVMLARQVMELRAKGWMYREIEAHLGVDYHTLYRLLRWIVDDMKAKNQDLIEEMFLVHHARLEIMYKKVQERIDVMEHLDPQLLRAAITILERQAKLLGLDKDKGTRGSRATYDWMEDMPDEQLLDEARRLGIRLPEKFKTGAI